RRIVEHGIYQVIYGPAAAHHGLADVDKLGRPGAEHMDPEQLAVLQADKQLEHPVGVADYLAAGQLAVAGHTDLERHGLLGELLLGPADEADLRDAVDADRLELVHAVQLLAAGVVGRDPALLHRRRRERGEADDVAHRVDVRHLGAEEIVDPDPAALVGG